MAVVDEAPDHLAVVDEASDPLAADDEASDPLAVVDHLAVEAFDLLTAEYDASDRLTVAEASVPLTSDDYPFVGDEASGHLTSLLAAAKTSGFF